MPNTGCMPGEKRLAIDALEIARRAIQVLEDKKGEDLALLDVRNLSGVTDYYLIVTGGSAPHLKAMFSEVQHRLKQEGVYAYRRSGVPESGWMAIDYVDLIIHIFLDSTRRYYGIEALWSEAPRLPVQPPRPRPRKSPR